MSWVWQSRGWVQPSRREEDMKKARVIPPLPHPGLAGEVFRAVPVHPWSPRLRNTTFVSDEVSTGRLLQRHDREAPVDDLESAPIWLTKG